MRVLNIHEREIPATPAAVGALLDSLASEDDKLWPGPIWPRMYFDRPLGAGAVGGHGPIAYAIEEYQPGRLIRFRFLGPRGFNGHHCFEVLPSGETGTLLRHTIDMSVSGPALFTWPLVIRPLHDALLEDAFAHGLASLGLPAVVKPWSAWVAVLRWLMSGGRAQSQQTRPRGAG